MSPHTKRSAKLPNASSFFPPPDPLPTLSRPLSLPFSLPLPHRRVSPPPPRFPRSFSPSPTFPAATPLPLPPLPPRPHGRGGRKKAKSAAPLLAARRLPTQLPPHNAFPQKKTTAPKKRWLHPPNKKNGARTPRLHPPPARTPSTLLPAAAANPVTTARPLGKPRPPAPPKKKA